MSFSRIKELTVNEFVGLAFAEFAHRRFSVVALTHYLSSLLADSFKVGHVQVVEGLIRTALAYGLVRVSHAKNGGTGFEVTRQGVDTAAEIQLPWEKFEHHAVGKGERDREAMADAGPIFDALLRAIPERDTHGRAFVQNVLRHWLRRGWLSSKQMAAVAQIGARCGMVVHGWHYVGAALEVWTAPYIEPDKEK